MWHIHMVLNNLTNYIQYCIVPHISFSILPFCLLCTEPSARICPFLDHPTHHTWRCHNNPPSKLMHPVKTTTTTTTICWCSFCEKSGRSITTKIIYIWRIWFGPKVQLFRVQKTWCPLVQDKLFCLWDKWEFVFIVQRTGCNSSAHFSRQAILWVLSSLLKEQVELKVGQGKQKTHLPTGY